MIEKAVVIRRATRLEELIARFNTRAQAKFYIEHAGGDFADYEREHDNYCRGLEAVESALRKIIKIQIVDRAFLPNFIVAENEVIVTVGQDGLVANAAKYVRGAPIVAVNPDPRRFDGVLLPFEVSEVARAVESVQEGGAAIERVTMAEAKLSDGQRLLAFNDFFVGASSHISARYRLTFDGRSEEQSSSGILISTGAGSTGWLSSVFNMARGVAAFSGAKGIAQVALARDARQLAFVVREPFVSRVSGAELVVGLIRDVPLAVESHMPRNGVIFSDGVEADYLAFNSGAIASIGVAPEVANRVVKGPTRRGRRTS
jgi:NAD kinase